MPVLPNDLLERLRSNSRSATAASQEPEPHGPDDQKTFAAMLAQHEAHVFDYLSRLLGDEAGAASTTATTMVAARSLLADPDRLRAWLFALARQEIAAKFQPAEQNPGAEIRDLVYRHGIRPADLPAVLGVSPERATAMLADAESDDDELADAAVPGEPDRRDELDARDEVDAPAEVDAAAPVVASAEVEAPAEVDAAADVVAPADVEARAEVAGSGQDEQSGEPGDDGPDESAEPPLLDQQSWIWELTRAAFPASAGADLNDTPAPVADAAVGPASVLAAPGARDRPAAFSRARRRLGISAALVAAAGAAAAGIVYLGGAASGHAETHVAQRANTGAAEPAVSSPAAPRPSPAARHSRIVPKHHHRHVRPALPLAQPPSVVVPVAPTSTTTEPAGVLTPQPRKSHHKPGHTSPPPIITPSPSPTPAPTPTPTATPSP
ncbi:MAG: hypothetical protein ACLQFR_06565 [Streptosporangiaceae bacterium]